MQHFTTIRHGGESYGFTLRDERNGRKIVCADTGNGGDTAYQLLRPLTNDPCDNFAELGYAATHAEAERRAIGLLNVAFGRDRERRRQQSGKPDPRCARSAQAGDGMD